MEVRHSEMAPSLMGKALLHMFRYPMKFTLTQLLMLTAVVALMMRANVEPRTIRLRTHSVPRYHVEYGWPCTYLVRWQEPDEEILNKTGEWFSLDFQSWNAWSLCIDLIFSIGLWLCCCFAIARIMPGRKASEN